MENLPLQAGDWGPLNDWLIRISSGSLSSSGYRLTSDGTTVTAFDKAGATVASGVDGGAVFTSVLALLPATGGHIEFRNDGNVFPWTTTPGLPRSITRKLTIKGNWATVRLSSSAPRMFDYNKIADYDTFQHIDIGEFVVDANNIGGQHHVVIGPWQNGSWLRKINLDDINVHDIRIINAVVGTSFSTDFRIGVHIGGAASTVNDTLCTFTNCSVKRIWSDGCLQLVTIHAPPVAAEAIANTFHDKIVVEDITHDLPTVPTAFNAGAHVMAGTKGQGGSIEISRVRGKNSPDVGVEYDGWQNVVLNDIIIEDAYDFAFYHANYRPPTDVEAQIATHVNCVARRRNLNDHGQGFSIVVPGGMSVTAVAATDIFTAVAHGFVNTDRVVFSTITGGAGISVGTAYFIISATTDTFQVSTSSGGAALDVTSDLTVGTVTPLSRRPGSFHFGDGCFYHRMTTSAGFTVQQEAFDFIGPRRLTGELHAVFEFPAYNGGTQVNPSGIRIRSASTSDRTDVRLKIACRVIGNNASTGTIAWRTLLLREGLLTNFDIDMLSDVQIATDGNAALIHADIGATAGVSSAQLSGRLKIDIPSSAGGGGGNTPVGIQFESGVINTVPGGELLIYNSDFAGLAAGSNNVVFTGATTLQSKTRFINNAWRVFPKPSAAMGASNFAAATFTTATGNQYIGNNQADIHFASGSGAAITLIEASKDGTTYESVYSQASGVMAQNVLVPVDHGDFIRVTFATTQPTTRVRFKKT